VVHGKFNDNFYTIAPDNVTLTAKLGKNNPTPEILRQDHGSVIRNVTRETLLNRAVRRQTTVLHAGDLPRFALGAVQKNGTNAPPQLNLGEVSITFVHNGIEYSLEMADDISVRHLPHGNEWTMRWNDLQGCEIKVLAAIMGETGIAAKITITGNSKGQFLLSIGNYRETTRTFEPSYFTKESVPFTPTVKNILKNHPKNDVLLNFWDMQSDAANVDMHWKWGLYTETEPEFTENKETIRCLVNASPVYLAATVSPLDKPFPSLPEDTSAIEKEIFASKTYFEKLLDSVQIKTESEILNAGIHHALLNLEYCFMSEGDISGWLEGGHYWNCYWTNNYQISAAIAAGQYDRARKTLVFYGTNKDGCDPAALNGRATAISEISAGDATAGNGASSQSAAKNYYGYDGLPYFLHQLWEYVEHTGDISIVSEIYESVDRNLKYLIHKRKTANGLLSWHLHCNSFLYQADGLALFGDALSPSIILAYGFEKFSKLLDTIGKTDCASFYSSLAASVKVKIDRALWDKKQNCYAALRDYADNSYYGHYYTDLVFPMLYGDVPEEHKILLLLHLKDTLLLKSKSTGAVLMRVGKLKPSQFGNDNVMPVQMCEAARAFCAAGDNETGYALVLAAAHANSVFTESPGSSPERLSDEGKGEYNYMFGNPAGSLFYSAVTGVFGIKITDMGTRLNFYPSLPLGETWKISLPYAEITANGKGYSISLPDTSNVKHFIFSICGNFTQPEIFMNDIAVSFSVASALGGSRITAEAEMPSSKKIKITVKFKEAVLESPPEIHVQKRESFTSDVRALPGQPNVFDKAGIYNILLEDKNQNAYLAQKIIIDEPVLPFVCTDTLTEENLSLANFYNNETVTVVDNLGNMSEQNIYFDEETASKYQMNVKARFIRLEAGWSNEKKQAIEKSSFPDRICIPINTRIRAIELLYCTSCAIHLTNAEPGEIILRYANKSEIIPIAHGKNFDSVWRHFASNTKWVPAKDHWFGANSLVLACDPCMSVSEMEIQMKLPDAQLSVIAAKVFSSPLASSKIR